MPSPEEKVTEGERKEEKKEKNLEERVSEPFNLVSSIASLGVIGGALAEGAYFFGVPNGIVSPAAFALGDYAARRDKYGFEPWRAARQAVSGAGFAHTLIPLYQGIEKVPYALGMQAAGTLDNILLGGLAVASIPMLNFGYFMIDDVLMNGNLNPVSVVKNAYKHTKEGLWKFTKVMGLPIFLNLALPNPYPILGAAIVSLTAKYALSKEIRGKELVKMWLPTTYLPRVRDVLSPIDGVISKAYTGATSMFYDFGYGLRQAVQKLAGYTAVAAPAKAP